MNLGEVTWPRGSRQRPRSCRGSAYIRPLGSGGFADVFLYEQDMPRRNVAVKVMPSDVRDPDLRRMFNAEADVLAHLSAHPSIVTVYQAGISADGRPYIVMEYCPGSLAQRYRIERIPVDEVLAIGVRMAAPSSPRTVPGSCIATSSRATSSSRRSALRCSPTSASRRRCCARAPTRCWRCRCRGARPRSSPSRPPDRSRARCGASARRCTPCSPATARSSDASAVRTPRSCCAGASPGRRTPRSPAPTCRPRCRPCSPRR